MRPPCSPTSVAGPCGSPSTQSSSRAPSSASRSCSSVASRQREPQVRLRSSCRTHGRPETRSPTTRRQSSPASSRQLDSVERDRPVLVGRQPHQHVGQRRLAGAAAADDRHAATRPQIEVDAVQHPRPGVAVARAQPPDRDPVWSWADRLRSRAARRRADRRRGPRSARPSDRRTRWSVWVAAGSPVASSNAASGTTAITASRTTSRRPARDGRDADQPGSRPSPAPAAASPAPGRCRRCPRLGGRFALSRASICERLIELAIDRPAGGQLGRAAHEVDDGRPSARPAPAPAAASLRRASLPVSHGQRGRGQQQRDQQDHARGRQDPPHERDRRRAYQRSRSRTERSPAPAGPAVSRRRRRTAPSGRRCETPAGRPARAARGAA